MMRKKFVPKIIPLVKKPQPWVCEHCGLPTFHLNLLALLMFCDECLRMFERAKAVQEIDIDQ
jgi:hypothetical protein